MRLRFRTAVSRTRNARSSLLLGASVGIAGLAALPVASEIEDAETDEPEAAQAVEALPATFALDALEDVLPADGVAGNPGLENWYSPEEAQRITPDVKTVQITLADAEVLEPEPEPASSPEPASVEQTSTEAPAPERNRWDRLAECESGEWVNGGESFIEGSARWDYGINFVHEGYEQFQGGLNFHPGTWDAFRDPDMPDHAGNATREQQIVVGERVLAQQGWQAWPRCSKMVGLR